MTSARRSRDARAIEGQCRIGLELVASTSGTLGSRAHPIKSNPCIVTHFLLMGV